MSSVVANSPDETVRTTAQRIALRAVKVAIISLIGSVIFLGAMIGVLGHQYVVAFSRAAGVQPMAFYQEVRAALSTAPLENNDRKQILFLGLDEVPGRDARVVLTDTILLASMSLRTGKVALISFPRDLWIDQYKTKINALYLYGQRRDAENPTAFIAQVVQEISDLPIHHTVVLRMDDLESLIDLLGGVEVNVERSFSDERFPVPGVDVQTVTDPSLLYKTVTFSQGVERMSGARALEYIRSRHSADLVEGTDAARVRRQQRLLEAIVVAITTPKIIQDPGLLGRIYAWYSERFSRSLSARELISTAKVLYDHKDTVKPSLATLSLSVKEYGKPGVLTHPPVSKYAQWVYEPLDRSWTGVRQEIVGFLQAQ